VVLSAKWEGGREGGVAEKLKVEMAEEKAGGTDLSTLLRMTDR